MYRYIHGSEDSLDVDVYYVFDKMPSFQECRDFCSQDPNENRNIIVVKDGIVSECFIGTIDEVNNALLDTYHLHSQTDPLIITKRVERDTTLKTIRAVRGILSILSRTNYRQDIKEALRDSWTKRIVCLDNIDFSLINYNELQKRMNGDDMLKVIAFQLGQTIGLYEGKELYTKSSIAKNYPELINFLYRKKDDLNILNQYCDKLISHIEKIKYQDLPNNAVYFIDEKRTFDLKHEKVIQNNEMER